MITRQARAEDAQAIADIWSVIIRDTLITFTTVEKTPAQVAQDIAARGLAFRVGEQAGQVMGFATYGPFRSGPGYAHTCEHSVQLAPEARGQGLGRLLMEELMQVARENSQHVMVAGISGAAPASIAFHAALGFVETARMPQVGCKSGQWLDLVMMQRILGAHPDTGGQTA